VAGLQDLDTFGRCVVAVAGYNDTGEVHIWPGSFDRLGHAGRSLSGPDNDTAASGLGRQRRGQDMMRVGGAQGRVEHRAQ
jgi:hypothetical protein